MVYQEQVMRILNRLGGIELSSAYTCIKAISKKKLETIAKFKEEFVAGATSKGLSRSAAVELFEMIEKFAGYGFNKSHSTAYALIAYITAYLKAHYPVEFMAALLSGDIDARNFKKKDSLVEHLDDCRRMNAVVAPPDVNRSEGDFTVVENQIQIGLCAIKGCGESAAARIVAARASKGPFRSLFDFCERVDPASVSRATIEALIKAGAFDSLNVRRSQLAAVVDRALQAGAAVHADRRSGQKGLFDADEEDGSKTAQQASLPNVPEWEPRQLLAGEKEVLGFYLSSHPLQEYAASLAAYCSHSATQLAKLPHRSEATIGGMLAAIKTSQTKRPRPDAVHTKYAMFDLEDMSGLMRCILWPEDYAAHGHLVKADAVVLARGVVDRRPGSEETNFIVNELIPLEEAAGRFTRGMLIRLHENTHTRDDVFRLREILRGYPGQCDVQFQVWLADGSRVSLKSDQMRIALGAELRSRVNALVGEENVRLLSAPPKASAPRPKAAKAFAGR
jgi:DNA polymerase-3 subunit alpha